ncbi:hypothetical protein [Roseomonas sp. BN140053]|uniref:hypothetical protein n=1 Tax=Roseomonas sp. BN140053 TaxID=3391898 RepID=UPI0039EB6B9A
MRLHLVGLGVALLALGGCATQLTLLITDLHPPGFFSALLHGLIAPFALVGGIFTEARVYAFPNSGWWYDFGFLLGLLPWGGIGASIAAA